MFFLFKAMRIQTFDSAYFIVNEVKSLSLQFLLNEIEINKHVTEISENAIEKHTYLG